MDNTICTVFYGITPACAGSISVLSIVRFSSRDHPRVCGKYYLKVRKRTAAWGSPPRVREVLNMIIRKYMIPGITPACAGSIKTPIRLEKNRWDHPRVCGKYAVLRLTVDYFMGSPPRVREVYCTVCTR